MKLSEFCCNHCRFSLVILIGATILGHTLMDAVAKNDHPERAKHPMTSIWVIAGSLGKNSISNQIHRDWSLSQDVVK